MTYFLEKYYMLDNDGHLRPLMYGHCLIRPCNWKYSKVLDYMRSTKSTTEMLCLEASIAMLDLSHQDFTNVEEWLIWLSLNKNIIPDFEETCIICRYHKYCNDYREYAVKLVDLHTKEVLYDKMDYVIGLLSS